MSEVLDSLNIDNSFFTQFGIVLVLFFVLKSFLFDKLKEVILDREVNTTGLLNKSKEKEVEANKISQKIEEEILATKNELSSEVRIIKSKLNKKNEEEYSSLENTLDKEYFQKFSDFEKEMNQNYEVLKTKTGSLASDLVNKITQ